MSAVYLAAGVVIGASMTLQGQDKTSPWWIMCVPALIAVIVATLTPGVRP